MQLSCQLSRLWGPRYITRSIQIKDSILPCLSWDMLSTRSYENFIQTHVLDSASQLYIYSNNVKIRHLQNTTMMQSYCDIVRVLLSSFKGQETRGHLSHRDCIFQCKPSPAKSEPDVVAFRTNNFNVVPRRTLLKIGVTVVNTNLSQT